MKKLLLLPFTFTLIFAYSQNQEGIGRIKMTAEQRQKNIELHEEFNRDLADLKARQNLQLEKLKAKHKKQIDRLHERHEKETDRIYTPEQLKILKEIRAKRERQIQKYK